MSREPYFLNIAPMLPGNEDALAQDIASMAKNGVITHNAFIFTLNPEGNPAFDKAAVLAERFVKHRAALRKYSDVPCGVLIQASIGHGWTPSVPTPGQKFVLANGSSPYIFCPLDPGFREYIKGQVRTLAEMKPDFFMLDDDFRMLSGRGGCFCPLHVEGFSKLTGTHYTHDSLVESVNKDEEIARAYEAYLQKTMEEVAQIMRDAIDSVTPGLPCAFCMCGRDIRHAKDTARVLQGNAPLRIRINNGHYMSESVRGMQSNMVRSAYQALYLEDEAEVLDEPDTCPQNRYSSSASMLHYHVALSMIAGYGGAKLWITRTNSWEPASGKAYREILAKYNGFYKTTMNLGFQQDGLLIPVPSEPPLNFPQSEKWEAPYSSCNWLTQTGVMGLPFRLGLASTAASSAAAVTGCDCEFLSDKDLEALMNCKTLLLDGSAAIALTERGFAERLGFTAKPWGDLPAPTQELEVNGNGRIALAAWNEPAFVKPAPDAEAQILSNIIHRTCALANDDSIVAPGMTVIRRPDGKRVIIMSVTLTGYGFSAFSYLNETRKRMLTGLLREELNAYYDGDAEFMIQTGHDCDGNRIVVCHAMSADVVKSPRLVFREPVTKLEYLAPDGKWTALPFTADGNAVIPELEIKALYPQVLRAYF